MKKRVLAILFPLLLTVVLAVGGWANEQQQPASGKPCCNKAAQAAQVQKGGCANCAKGQAATAGCQNCVKGGGAGCANCANCAACENCAKGGDCANCPNCAKSGAAGCANCVKRQGAQTTGKMPCGGCAKQNQGETASQGEVKQADPQAGEVRPCCDKSKKK